ncbi:MAG: bifunctional DNA-formamidopyrimidine glycosylase/DNA-(apurinic or apyrimidinic site) lyase [Victivallales bacterium]|nr:bifunctional DNA-formamidopyrimidine glycosylase/DNA-(apurinic or apyrimidinic site) lyase [Victivallales bacterium]
MPELPEVETICRALAPALTGRTITRVELFSPKLRSSLTPLPEMLTGRRILAITRRARYIIAPLDNALALVMHFGMTGVARIESPDVPRRTHEHVFLHLDDGFVFRFEDIRRFGNLEVLPLAANGLPMFFQCFGPEPFSDQFTAQYLYKCSRNLKCPVKTFLMDNAVVAGIGNIYATETLFAAGISPCRPAGTLSRRQCEKLVEQSRHILNAAIEQGGTTIADFKHVDGSEGKFAVCLQIYGKTGEACPHCGHPIQCIRLGGRSSAFCPKCQK